MLTSFISNNRAIFIFIVLVVTDALAYARNFNIPSASTSYLPVDFVAKHFQASATTHYNQSGGLLLQSHTDLSAETVSTSKKGETCFGRWQSAHQQHTFEPLHIQVSVN